MAVLVANVSRATANFEPCFGVGVVDGFVDGGFPSLDASIVGTKPSVQLLNGSSAILPGGDTLVDLDMYFHIGSRCVDGPTVGTTPSVLLINGSSAILPCQYHHDVYEIYWVQQNGHEPRGDTLVHLDIYFDTGKRSGKGVDEGRFNTSDDFSLLIEPVIIQDYGRYSCIVSDIASGNSYQNYTDVTVYVYANTTSTNFVTIKQCEDLTNLNQSTVFQEIPCINPITDNQTVFQLNCLVYVAMPEISLSWTTNGTNVGTYLTFTIEDREDGTLDQILTMTGSVNETKNGTVFTCVAEGLSVGGLANSSVIFFKTEHQSEVPSHEPTGSTNLLALKIALPIAVGFAATVIVGFFVWRNLRHKIQDQRIPDSEEGEELCV
ncbi:uncharacterized protein LOC135155550 [Lytechinus pictus]|uniref:uncharacterized protein LOC135155550 n=1 Tax=Lytechinus pictus TaxID=7653 RepID=UPI0030B9BDCE